MVLRIIKGVMGSGVSVETVLSAPYVYPGGRLRGDIQFLGGDVDQGVRAVTLEFNALVDQVGREDERKDTHNFHRIEVCGPFQLPANANYSIPFEIRAHWESPISAIDGRPLTGMKLGVATELTLDKAFDKEDLDPLTVEPLPVQSAVLQAVKTLGFEVQGARLVNGTVAGSELGFHQEIQFWASGEFGAHFKELTVTFVTNSTTTDAILQVDNPHGPAVSTDSMARFTAQNSVPADFTDTVRAHLGQLAQRHPQRH